MKIENFGRNIAIFPKSIYMPESEEEVLAILERHRGESIRCIGRLHSWSKAIHAEGVVLDLRKLSQVQAEERAGHKHADIGAGCQVKAILEALKTRNWTLPSVGFITEQSIGGAIATGTHGSGRNSLSHYVQRVRIARYDRQTGSAIVDELDSGDPLLAARCSLGCIGVVLSVRMECREDYSVEEHFQEFGQVDDVLQSESEYPLQQFYLVPWKWSYVAQQRKESTVANSMSLQLYLWYRYIVLDWMMHLVILLCVRVLRSN